MEKSYLKEKNILNPWLAVILWNIKNIFKMYKY